MEHHSCTDAHTSESARNQQGFDLFGIHAVSPSRGMDTLSVPFRDSIHLYITGSSTKVGSVDVIRTPLLSRPSLDKYLTISDPLSAIGTIHSEAHSFYIQGTYRHVELLDSSLPYEPDCESIQNQ